MGMWKHEANWKEEPERPGYRITRITKWEQGTEDSRLWLFGSSGSSIANGKQLQLEVQQSSIRMEEWDESGSVCGDGRCLNDQLNNLNILFGGDAGMD
jgi:hypothetical protein